MPPAAVPIVPVGPVAVATMVFREAELLNVVAIVKATFAFEHHGPMRPAAPEPVTPHEVHRMNNPTRSVSATSDLVPRLPGADVLVLGQAHAPGGSATQVVARLVVGRGDTTLLDKSILVVGDRKGSQIKPFRSIPLVYEKAFGGPGFRDNPLGTGVLSGDPPPNLLDPRAAADGRAAVGFGPISRSWPARAAMVSPDVRAGLDRPISEIPPGFDFRYFHAAPPDQRLAHLLGDEWIVLENMHAKHAVLHLELPGPQAQVRVTGQAGSAPRVFSLRADTLRIDVDAERCTIVWRNSFRVADGELGALRLAAGIALPGATIAWPDDAAAQPVHSAFSTAASLPAADGGTILLEDRPAQAHHSSTIEVGDEDIESISIEGVPSDLASTAILGQTAAPATTPLAAPATTPFQATALRGDTGMSMPASLPRAPAGGTTLDLATLSPDTTAPLTPAEAVGPSTADPRSATPFAAPGGSSPAPGAPQPARRRPAALAGSTLDLTGMRPEAKAVLPFAKGAPAAGAETRGHAPIPGAPWSRSNPHALPDENAPTLEVGASGVTLVAPVPAALRDPDPPIAPPSTVAPATPPAMVAPPPAMVAPPPAMVAPPPAMAPLSPPAMAPPPVAPPLAVAPPAAPAPLSPPPPPVVAPPVERPSAPEPPQVAEKTSAQPAFQPQPPASPPPQHRETPKPPGGEDPWGRSLRAGQAPPPEEAAPPPPKAPAAPTHGGRATDQGKGLKDALYRRFKKG